MSTSSSGVRPGGRRVRHVAASLGTLALTGALGLWAGRVTVISPLATDLVVETPSTATVVEASVGRSVPVGVSVLQPVEPLATNLLPGVVTAVNRGALVAVGDKAYEVDGVPVRVVPGTMPFYRDLTVGADGQDVRQLQDALVALGYLQLADGEFGRSTEQALRLWQREAGTEATGRVARGELIAVATLSADLRLGEGIRLGSLLAGGEEALLGPTGEQIFEATISADQAALIPRDAVFRVMFDNSTWSAVVSASRVDEYDNTVLVLAGEGGGPVCADACGTLPGDEKATLRAEAIIVPEVTGATIPAAAIRTDTDGNQYVTLADNTTVSVSVMASAQGLVVVEGLRLGQVVLIDEPKPSEIAPASEADPTAAGASTGEAH